MNRFVDNADELVLLTQEEFERPDRVQIAHEKERLLGQGFSTFELQDLAAFHKANPDVVLKVAV